MRVQHNIMAMNAYRNYNNNTKSLSGNLEKLSSGYKINRAGDDAAGLAISEKMRAQITGLNAAQKNVKDGISLVKTAEGAMQEIQDMLNRMDYLATQSANGTYQNEVDRENLNKEVTALKTEINRIADSANFNGIKLLDGSLAATGGGSATTGIAKPTVDGFALATASGAKADYTLKFASAASSIAEGTLSINVTVNGKNYSYDFEVKKNSSDGKLYVYNGEETVGTAGSYQATHNIDVVKTGAQLGKGDFGTMIADKLQADLGSDYTVTAAASGVQIVAKKDGADTVKIGGAGVSYTKTDRTTNNIGSTVTANTPGKNVEYSADVTKFELSTKASAMKTYTLNGKKFAFMDLTATAVAEEAKKVDSSITIINIKATPTAGNVDDIAAQLSQMTGLNIAGDKANSKLIFKPSTGGGGGGGASGGLKLQIGDTADSFNQMMVAVGDMHTRALGIDGIDISNQDGAAAAIATVKDAINTVSSVRGDLGAIQNRLDHTANNLSVMAENIQDAESTIRDTDVAEEMMSYVKNNILVQSAQAMLAQANQVPQGVLQLLG